MMRVGQIVLSGLSSGTLRAVGARRGVSTSSVVPFLATRSFFIFKKRIHVAHPPIRKFVPKT